MRIALISDIHGNLTALEAALNDCERQKVDRLICLGDVAVLGPQPRQVVRRLQELSVPVIMGNTDGWLLDPQPWPTEDEGARRQLEIEMWAAEQLTDVERSVVAAYAPTLTFDFGDGFTLLCYHGSPRSFNDPIKPDTPNGQLEEYFGRHRPLIMAGGHTHEVMVRRYGASYILNPGSIGLPVIWLADGRVINPSWAEYALLDWRAGDLTIDLRRVSYPPDDLAAAARHSGMPHADYYLADWRDKPALGQE